MSVLAWQGEIKHDFEVGNLLMIANAADFAHWTGSKPLPKSERRELCVYSPFTAELPEAFRPCGPAGYQYIPAATYSELEHLRDELIAYVVGRWPGTTIDEDRSETWWVLKRPDGKRLNVQFYPMSEYDRCSRDFRDFPKVHTFDRHRRAIIWAVQWDNIQVARDTTGRLALAEVPYAEDEDMAAYAAQWLLNLAASDPLPFDVSPPFFDVSPGPLVVALAQHSADDEGEGVVHDDTSTAKPGEILDFSLARSAGRVDRRRGQEFCGASSGVALAIPAGRYAVRTDTMDGDDWEISCCVFDRMTTAQQGDAADPAARRGRRRRGRGRRGRPTG
jgi:hypothetical protein